MCTIVFLFHADGIDEITGQFGEELEELNKLAGSGR